MNKAYFGGGCFWCIDAIYQQIKGVEAVISGYAGGGTVDIPSYYHHGNHAEVIEVTYDPEVIAYEKLVEVFWNVHNPTTLDRQGVDIGASYRSIVLTTTAEELEIVMKSKQVVGQSLWDDPIVTEIKPLDNFTVAEAHHQNYSQNNAGNQYCQVVINPKIQNFHAKFGDLVKDSQ